jgi:hypothetical protein
MLRVENKLLMLNSRGNANQPLHLCVILLSVTKPNVVALKAKKPVDLDVIEKIHLKKVEGVILQN